MSHTIQAVAWTLIHFCWQAAAAAALYWAASFALVRRTSNTRYLVTLAALLLMLGASVVTFSWEMRPRHAAFPIAYSAGASADAAAADSGAHNGYKFSPLVTPVADAPTPMSPGSSLASLLPWIDCFWLAGVMVLSVRSIGGWWLIQRLRTSASMEAPPSAVASFNRISAALGLARPAVLRVSSAIAGPLTVGALRALVLLPLSAATSLSPDELEVVIAHELAHVRRADFFWNLIQTMVETLFFFHPAVWWIGNKLRHERELCCDDLALKVCPDPLVYARALFRLEEQRTSNWQLAMALDGHQSPRTLRARIARILGEPIMLTANRRPISLAAAGALLVVLILPVPQVLAGLTPAKSPSPVALVKTTATVKVAQQVRVVIKAPVTTAVAAGLSMSGIIAPEAGEVAQTTPAQPQETAAEGKGHKGDYIDRMKAAGYDVDLDKMIAMKIQDVTPEYAQEMSKIGFGKLSADQLIAMKIQDVTPDYIAQIKAAGYDVDVDKMIAMKIQDVTPEYARDMEKLGFGKLSADDLIASKIQDVTPEYVAQLKRDGLEVKNVHEAISYRIFDVTPQFVSEMKAAGFGELSHDQLMSLRTQDVTPEYAKSIRQQYPGASIDDIVKTKIFNIDAGFIASAKRHGFSDLTLEKLVKLRISGILDDNDSESK